MVVMDVVLRVAEARDLVVEVQGGATEVTMVPLENLCT